MSISSRYAQKRVLILGSTGLVGRWVARLLSHSGAELILQIRDQERADEVFRDFVIRGRTVNVDLTGTEQVSRLIKDAKPAIVFNLAGYGIDRSETSESLSYAINRDLVEVICRALSDLPQQNWHGQELVHAGSAMEYGAVPGNLEEDSEERPVTVYGRSKLAGTKILKAHCERTGLKGATARLFAIYGPGESPTRLLPTLIGSAGGHDRIELTEGLHRRDFTYVADAAEGLLRLGLSDAGPGSVVNIATGKLTSIREFTETAASVIGIEPDRLAFGALPTRPEEMFNESVSVLKCRKLLDWVPPTPVNEGIRRTLELMRDGDWNSGQFPVSSRPGAA